MTYSFIIERTSFILRLSSTRCFNFPFPPCEFMNLVCVCVCAENLCSKLILFSMEMKPHRNLNFSAQSQMKKMELQRRTWYQSFITISLTTVFTQRVVMCLHSNFIIIVLFLTPSTASTRFLFSFSFSEIVRFFLSRFLIAQRALN